MRALPTLLLAWTLAGAAAAAPPTWPLVKLALQDGTWIEGELVDQADGAFYLLLPDGTLRPVPYAQVARVLREDSEEAPPAAPPPAPREPQPPPPRTWIETTVAVPAPPYPGPPDPPPEQAEPRQPLAPDHATLALELSALAAAGARLTVPVERPLLASWSLRAGVAASPIAYQTTTQLRRFASLEGSWWGVYLEGALDLPLRVTTLELGAGPALLPMPQTHLGYTVGAALHTWHRAHWSSHVGVLWMSDICGREPFLVIDIGPEWSW
ncbi:MAG: hypothetical protein ABIO70_21945 [Pseudomonadota bacterium]